MEIAIQPLKAHNLDAAFELATEVFSRASTLHRALGVTLEDYRIYLRPQFRQVVAQGLSVVAIDTRTGAVMGCMIVTDYAKQPAGDIGTYPVMTPLAALARELDHQYTAAGKVSPGQVILIDMGAVRPEAEGRGIYQSMRAQVHTIAKSKGFQRVVGELSSAATQHVVLTQLGHAKMAEVSFHDFECDGAFPFRTITQPRSIVLAEGQL
jgi:hypothetical protein